MDLLLTNIHTTLSDFQVTLADPIPLNCNWEVALQEATYVHSANMNQVGFVFERPPDLYKNFIEAVDIPNDVAVSELVHDHKHFHLTLFRKEMKMTIILKKDPDEEIFLLHKAHSDRVGIQTSCGR